jgi:hypothetical protein
MEISIRDILAKHPVPGIREAQIRDDVAKVVTKLTGVEVAANKVRYTEGRVVLNVPPVLKSALLLRSAELNELLQKQGVQVTEIR